MALTLWNLFETSLLCLNAFTIINEERFKSKCTMDSKQNGTEFGCDEDGRNMEMFNLIHSISTIAKFPIIFLNVLTILLKLILGS
ncbi:hypothetical protein NQ318_015890 [Aromia moschata]|uniref:Immediate early response 3-interacting protein 1 n=1 Tax=Aromia moschata TaxID=1265417 RepID=A0AAV8XZU9_9CUCU|nr:hypothetical protein NQ318_015890 [Aromia moschata]